MFSRVITAVLLASSLALPALAQEEGDIPGGRAALEQFAQGLEAFHATFRQVVLDSDGEQQDASDGVMWLSRPALFRWEYNGDFPEVIVADGTRVWMYDVSLEQITVKDQSGLASDSPLTLLTDLDRLDEQFEVRDLGVDGRLAFVELRAKSDDAEFDRVLLGIEGQELRLIAMEDAFGLRTEIRIESSDRNPELAEGQFVFVPPEGVDIVGDIALLGNPENEEAE